MTLGCSTRLGPYEIRRANFAKHNATTRYVVEARRPALRAATTSPGKPIRLIRRQNAR